MSTERDEDRKLKIAQIVKIVPMSTWVEKDLFGTVHIKMQHEGFPPFTFIQMHYDYAYTSNSHQHEMTQKIMALLGVTEIEYREAPNPFLGSTATTSSGEREG